MEKKVKMSNFKGNSILSGSEDNASVYLSFDSTLSNTAFQTMDSESMEVEDQSTIECDSNNLHMESTLEAKDHTWHAKTVEKIEIPTEVPSNMMPKHLLHELKGNSSTPNKGPLHDIELPSSPIQSNVVEVIVTMPNLKDSKDLYASDEENKENTPPMICANLSVTSTKHSKVEIETASNLSNVMMKSDVADKKDTTTLQENKTLTDNINKQQSSILLKKMSDLKESSKPKTNFNTKITRKSVCEPNLQTNRPSRISVANTEKQLKQYRSTTRKSKIGGNTFDIPKIKVSRQENTDISGPTTEAVSSVNSIKSSANENNKLIDNKTKSQLPISQVNRRRPSLLVRAPTVVRPSVNSPARQLQRKSVFPNSTLASRKSLLPIKFNSVGSGAKLSGACKSDLAPLKESESDIESIETRSISQSQTIAKKESTMNSKFQSVKQQQKRFSTQPAPRSEPSYTCSICACKFRIKSLLDAHRYTHLTDQSTGRKPVEKQNTAASIATSDNQCKYCDKKFALLRTLHIHLLQNCPKIPPTEKRKLEFTEMNHVEKAQLPNVFHAHHSNSGSINTINKRGTMGNVMGKKSDSSLSSNQESLVDYAGINDMKRDFDTESIGSGQMLPPSNNYIKKSAVHAGVYITPKKAIACNNCNKHFKTVLDYTEHCFKHHFNKTARRADDEQTD